MFRHLTSTAKSARARKPAALLGVLAVVFGIHTATSAGSPAVAAPTITSKPANPANETSATFTFSNGLLTGLLSGLTYQCSLDGAAFSTCTSAKTYTGLATGSHTFQVRAKRPTGELSDAASHTWAIDLAAPPAPTITSKPGSLSSDLSPSFAFSDAESGVTFRCKLDGAGLGDCSSPKSYLLILQGSHTFQVVAVDAAGNISTPASYTWALDSLAPLPPLISAGPSLITKASTATFKLGDIESPVTFECRRDGADWAACASPKTYLHITGGNHDFAVRAVDPTGNRSLEVHYLWRVTQEKSEQFSISGNAVGPLFPGAPAQPVAVKLTNPNSDPIYVTSLALSVASSSSAACSPSANLAITQAPVSEAGYVLVPANGSVTLPAQGIAAPTVRMLNLPVNQDACQQATFTFSYSGSAHS